MGKKSMVPVIHIKIVFIEIERQTRVSILNCWESMSV